MLRFCAAFVLSLLLSSPTIFACGFNFVGDCSTSISLKINGTQDSFAVASCPGVLKFDGFALGDLQSLSIARVKATTWESCQNNVSGVALFYRVFEKGFPGGSWQSIDLQEYYNTLVGPYTTRYRSADADQDLTAGLITGKTYVLEIYYRAEVDTIGDDFIPETFLLQNNNGDNYHFTFRYGGAAAPPFVVATTKIVHVPCHGDSTGVAGISVYGDQSGLFYQWSTGGNNYWILSEIPAGTYSVTVTGAGGYSVSDTMEIMQPAPLTKVVDAEICFGDSYSLGGKEFTESGNFSVVLDGSPNCDTVVDLHLSVLNPALALEDLPATAAVTCAQPVFDLCAGTLSNTTFQWFQNDIPTVTTSCISVAAGGNYEITAATAGTSLTCPASTSVLIEEHLFLSPPQVFGAAVGTLGCSPNDTIHLVLHAVTSAEEPVFQWILNGNVISTADSCMIAITGLPGPFEIPSVTVTDKYGCSSTQIEANIIITQPPLMLLSPEVTDASGPDANDGAIQLDIFGGSPPFEVNWDNGAAGTMIENLSPGTYCAVVSDANGCTVSVCATVFYTVRASELSGSPLKVFPNPAMAGEALNLVLPENFIGQEISLEILDLPGRSLLRQTVPFRPGIVQVYLPLNATAGLAVIRLTGKNGKNAMGRFTIR
ncbi:MAG: hypothetical protein EPGJADBJ_00318 [Saprospiraceae bacterium]|nr:hypothetical protein [Saprospiraceae bacterium]